MGMVKYISQTERCKVSYAGHVNQRQGGREREYGDVKDHQYHQKSNNGLK